MKKIFATVLLLLMMFTGCSDAEVISDNPINTSSSFPNATSSVSSSSKNSSITFSPPAPTYEKFKTVEEYLDHFKEYDLGPVISDYTGEQYSAEYGNKTVTLTVETVTNVCCSGSYNRIEGYKNGYFLFEEDFSELYCDHLNINNKYTLFDLNGKRANNYLFEELTCFDKSGKAVAMVPLYDGDKYIYINKDGEYVGDANKQDFTDNSHYKDYRDPDSFKWLSKTPNGKYHKKITDVVEDGYTTYNYSFYDKNNKKTHDFGEHLGSFDAGFVNDYIYFETSGGNPYNLYSLEDDKELFDACALYPINNDLMIFIDENYHPGVCDKKGNIILNPDDLGGETLFDIYYIDGKWLSIVDEHFCFLSITVK